MPSVVSAMGNTHISMISFIRGKTLTTRLIGLYQTLSLSHCRCGNVAAIFELDENLKKGYTIFEAAPNVSQSILELQRKQHTVEMVLRKL